MLEVKMPEDVTAGIMIGNRAQIQARVSFSKPLALDPRSLLL
jgi:hypothetical protein